MDKKVLNNVDNVLEKMTKNTPIEKILIMDVHGSLVSSYPRDAGDKELCRIAFDTARCCLKASKEWDMGDGIRIEVGSADNTLLIVGIDRSYLVALRSKGGIDYYMMIAHIIKLFHEYDLGTRVSKLAISPMVTKG